MVVGIVVIGEYTTVLNSFFKFFLKLPHRAGVDFGGMGQPYQAQRRLMQ